VFYAERGKRLRTVGPNRRRFTDAPEDALGTACDRYITTTDELASETT